MSGPQHISSQFLPAGEIDARILRGDDEVRRELVVAVKQVEAKVDKLVTDMSVLTGTAEMPGILARLERSNERVEASVAEMAGGLQLRGISDAQLRREVDELKDKVEAMQLLINGLKVLGRVASMVSSAITGKAPKTTFGIFFLVLWVAAWQFLHTVLPAIKFSLLHHYLAF